LKIVKQEVANMSTTVESLVKLLSQKDAEIQQLKTEFEKQSKQFEKYDALFNALNKDRILKISDLKDNQPQ